MLTTLPQLLFCLHAKKHVRSYNTVREKTDEKGLIENERGITEKILKQELWLFLLF